MTTLAAVAFGFWGLALVLAGYMLWSGEHAPYREDELRDRPRPVACLEPGRRRTMRERRARRWSA